MILDDEEQRKLLLDIIQGMQMSGPMANIRQFIVEKLNPLELAVSKAIVEDPNAPNEILKKGG
jgi:hypothetical protein